MCITILEKYKGRFGNNILQIVCGCHYAFVLNNCKQLIIPKDTFEKKIFTSSNILSNECGCLCDNVISVQRFQNFGDYIQKHKLTLYDMKQLLQKYLKPIINRKELDMSKTFENVIHIRSGDVANIKHGIYAMKPNSYYDSILSKMSGRVLVVCEDYNNDNVNYLMSKDNVDIQSSGKWSDFATLVNSKNLGLSVGTFGITAYLMSNTIKTIYMSNDKYLPPFGKDPNVKIIVLGN